MQRDMYSVVFATYRDILQDAAKVRSHVPAALDCVAVRSRAAARGTARHGAKRMKTR